MQRRGHPARHTSIGLEEQSSRPIVEEAQEDEPTQLAQAHGEVHPTHHHQHSYQQRGKEHTIAEDTIRRHALGHRRKREERQQPEGCRCSHPVEEALELIHIYNVLGGVL